MHNIADNETIHTDIPTRADSTEGFAEQDNGGKTNLETSIRVGVSLLDSLMTLAGELVLCRNQLIQTLSTKSFKDAETVGQRIDLITSELQEAIMLTRMQPVGNVFSKFPRAIRDLSGALKKNIDLSIQGKDVELDKTIIESISDPLAHLIRNAAINGIELPEDRSKTGKEEVGQISLRAFHEAGQVVIEIEDDGRGIDGNAIAVKALNKGIVTGEQLQKLTENEKQKLIFLPGMTTPEEVKETSDLNVDMEVVKSSLDKLGGNIELNSEKNKGTKLSIKLPLTLAIIPCQIIETEGERYAIPQINLNELIRIPAHRIKERVELVGDAEVVRLRGKLLPIIRLTDVLNIESTYLDQETDRRIPDRRKQLADRRSKRHIPVTANSKSEDIKVEQSTTIRSKGDRRSSPKSALNIVVVSTGSLSYGLVVDRLIDSEEIVIKPLGRYFQNFKGYAGATIMGDGRVALILDVANIAAAANLSSHDSLNKELTQIERVKDNRSTINRSFLIFRSSEEEHFAVNLDEVERIEDVKQDDIEFLGGRRVMQYKDGSLPLVCVEDLASVQTLAEAENYPVLVFNQYDTPFGLLVKGPIDTVELSTSIDHHTLKQVGVEGSTIINEKTTMIVNVREFFENCIQ